MRAKIVGLVAILALAGPAVAATQPPVAARDAVIRPAGPGQAATAAYLTLENLTARPLRLGAVRCACADMIEPHQSEMAGGIMRMRPAGPLVIPPHGSLAFQPGGLHLMVMGVKQPIRAGDHVPIRFSFDHGPEATVAFTTRR